MSRKLLFFISVVLITSISCDKDCGFNAEFNLSCANKENTLQGSWNYYMKCTTYINNVFFYEGLIGRNYHFRDNKMYYPYFNQSSIDTILIGSYEYNCLNDSLSVELGNNSCETSQLKLYFISNDEINIQLQSERCIGFNNDTITYIYSIGKMLRYK